MSFIKAPQYTEPTLNSKLSKLKKLFTPAYQVKDDIRQKQITRAASRRGSKRGSIIDAVIKDGSLERVFQSIASGKPITAACTDNDIRPVTFGYWIRHYPLLADKFEKCKALGARAKQEKNLAQGIVPKQRQLSLEEFYFDVNNLTKEQIEAKYGTDSVMLEYAKLSNPNF